MEGSELYLNSPYSIAFKFSRNSDYAANLGAQSATVQPAGSSNDTGSDQSSLELDNPDTTLTYDFDKYPQPSSLGAPWGIDAQSLRREVIHEAVRLYPLIYPKLGRPPTQEEADVIAEYTGRGVRQGSYGPALGTSAAIFREISTFRTGSWHLPLPFRWPRKYERRAGFDPNVVKIFGREILKGQGAMAIQRLWRLSLFAFVGTTLGRVYFDVCRHQTFAIAATDGRLKEIAQAARAVAQDHRKELVDHMKAVQEGKASRKDPVPHRSHVVETAGQDQVDPTGQGQIAMTEKWRRHRAGIGAPEMRTNSMGDEPSMRDDLYAQPDMVGDDRFSESMAQAEQERRSQRQVGRERNAEGQQQARQAPYQRPIQQQPFPQANNEYESSGNDEDFFSKSFSSSSPSSMESQSPKSSPLPASSRPGGSAWDRIRKGNASPVAKPSPDSAGYNSQQDSMSPRADSEKDQAQMEFDRMLERERTGESTGRRGW